jgi:hypothetical protein
MALVMAWASQCEYRWFRFEDGTVIEHWANRDDLGMGKQLGWVPPPPTYLIKMARAKRRAKRSGA